MKKLALILTTFFCSSALAGPAVIWGAPYPIILGPGGIKFEASDTSTACGASTAGAIRYNAGTFEGCNGSAWSSMSGGGGSGTVTSVASGSGLLGGPITTSGTLSVDSGTTANKIVKLDGSGSLPAVDGFALTNLNAATRELNNLTTTAINTNLISNSDGAYTIGNPVNAWLSLWIHDIYQPNNNIHSVVDVSNSSLRYGATGAKVVDWGLQYLQDLSQVISVDWVDRGLVSNDGRFVLSWPGSSIDISEPIHLTGSSSGFVGLSVPAAAGSTTYILPSADGSSGQFLSTDGSANLSWASASSAIEAHGSAISPVSIVPGTGIVPTSSNDQVWWIIPSSGSGAVSITATPPIAAGTSVGQRLTLKSTAAVNYLVLPDVSGVDINGPVDFGPGGQSVELMWDGASWSENGRRI